MNNEFTFFWGWDHENGYLSNFYYAPYWAHGQKFLTSEQEFMYRKAQFFGDEEIAEKILTSVKPFSAKKLGRKVKNYDEKAWGKIRYEVMKEVLMNKFSYSGNEKLLKRLLNTEGTLVEASPTDDIWGIGIFEDDPDAKDQSKWNGQNLLGFALCEVRNKLK